MSIKLMSAIFEAELHDLDYEVDGEKRKAKASTAKLVLLSIADHANDYGEGSYPGIDKLIIKTSLSRQGLLDTIAALEYNGLLSVGRKESRIGTNNYTVNIRAFPQIARDMPDIVKPLDSDKSSHLTQDSQATRPESSINHQLTIQRANKTVDAILETERKAKGKQYTQLPEIFIPYARAFADATGIQPSKRDLMEWLSVIQDWMNAGYQPSDVTEAVRDIIAEGKISIARPASITFKLRSLGMAKRAEPHYYQPAPIIETGPAVPPPHRVIV